MEKGGFDLVFAESREGYLEVVRKYMLQTNDLKPSAAMLDWYGANIFYDDLKSVLGTHPCKIYMLWSGAASSVYSMMAPVSESGISDFAEITDKYMANSDLHKGRTRDEILTAVSLLVVHSHTRS
ncbi:hypothetical protein MRB53_037602 [Persea americana]|nr:hypothetical protein MRB53_037602 [Persea americana]